MKKGKILRVKFGVNPNSSSIGSDLSYILMGVITAFFLVNLLDAGIRIWFGRKKGADLEKN